MSKKSETIFEAISYIPEEVYSMERKETSAESPRGKKLLRVGLIAAVITVLFGVVAFASGLLTLRDGITYQELADSSAVIESAIVPVATPPGYPDATENIEYRRIYADENEEMTQESTLNRMLNAVDYYDYASVTFMEQNVHPGEYNPSGEDVTYKYTVMNDVELTTGRGYSTVTRFEPEDEPLDLELYCNGKIYIELDMNKREIHTERTPRHRMTAEEYDFFIKDKPVHYVDEYGYEGWNNRTDWPNAYHSSSCIMPNM